MIDVRRIENPALFMPHGPGESEALWIAKAELAELLEAGMKDPANHPLPQDAAAWLVENLHDERVALFVARRSEVESWAAFILIEDFASAFAPHPCVLFLYARGNPALRTALCNAVVGWLRERGRETACAINRSGIPDDAYLRTFASVAPGRVLGSYIEFDLRAEDGASE